MLNPSPSQLNTVGTYWGFPYPGLNIYQQDGCFPRWGHLDLASYFTTKPIWDPWPEEGSTSWRELQWQKGTSAGIEGLCSVLTFYSQCIFELGFHGQSFFLSSWQWKKKGLGIRYDSLCVKGLRVHFWPQKQRTEANICSEAPWSLTVHLYNPLVYLHYHPRHPQEGAPCCDGCIQSLENNSFKINLPLFFC